MRTENFNFQIMNRFFNLSYFSLCATALPSPSPTSRKRFLKSKSYRRAGVYAFSHNKTDSRLYSTKTCLDPWFLTGFTDGEGCFNITISKDSRQKIGWRVKFSFQIGLSEKDITLLEKNPISI